MKNLKFLLFSLLFLATSFSVTAATHCIDVKKITKIKLAKQSQTPSLEIVTLNFTDYVLVVQVNSPTFIATIPQTPSYKANVYGYVERWNFYNQKLPDNYLKQFATKSKPKAFSSQFYRGNKIYRV